ncbi:MAG: methyl-accepting chemotaxis protein, partial [Ectothiorhodospiraceae bacterium]|nr:methyl-accepting chemotaxis protein [Ectothiorhodospiraceae bacterium]
LGGVAQLGERMNADSGAAARNASSQAQDTDSLSASITEMSASVEEVARNAAGSSETMREFSERLGSVQQSVSTASDTLQEMVKRLELDSRNILKLEQQGEDIGTILDVIRDVAERTNLLALNAAIEAARAGGQGRGFAVVAEEVRNLASQSQQSAQQIETMIDQLQEVTRASASGMRNGLEETSRSATTMSDASRLMGGLLEDVQQLDQAATQIATAAEEQSAVAVEIDRRVVSIRDLARETRGHAESTAGNATQMRERVEELSRQLRRFRLHVEI